MKKLLELLGIQQKRARPVGQSLEKSKEEERAQNARKRLFIKGGIIVLLLALVMAAFPRENIYQVSVREGDIWREENLVAPFSFPIYKNDSTLQKERAAARQEIEPVFQIVPEAQQKSSTRLDSLAGYLERVLQTYASWQLNRSRDRAEQATADSLQYQQLRNQGPINLSEAQWEMLAGSYLASVPGLPTESRTGSNEKLNQRLVQDVGAVLGHLYRNEVLDIPVDTIPTEQIVARDQKARTEKLISRRSVYGFEEAMAYAQKQLSAAYAPESDTLDLALKMFNQALVPSLHYLAEETQHRMEERLNQIMPTHGMVQEGQVIVRRGEKVDEEIQAMLTSLERFRAERTGNMRGWKAWVGQFFLLASILSMFFLYLYLLHGEVFQQNRHILLISILFGLIVGLFGIAVRLSGIPVLAVPVGIASILLTIVYNSRIGIVGTITLALLGGAMAGFDYEFTLATAFAGVLAVFSVRDVRNRGQIVVSAGLAFAAYALAVGAFSLLQLGGWDRFQTSIGLVGINVVLLLFAHPLLWIVERTFNITTDLTLLELSDTNRPLLKELSMRAPGSFHHSLQVANLGEAAADAIGANGLLVRVGALYHDIGKMLKPEYFIENQRVGENPHDKLSPHMSALILASHVKDGVELGRQHGLPQAVLKFIPMHHGTTLMEYFYRKAREQESEESSPISEAEFRYPGPIPNSKETGILMVADSVEAAVRSLDKPTPRKLETLIDSIFKSRLEDGQMDHSPLTFADLETIKQAFITILSSMHHIRVKYPGQEEKEAQAEKEEAAATAEKLPNGSKGEETNKAEGETNADGHVDASLPPVGPEAEAEEREVGGNGHSSSEKNA